MFLKRERPETDDFGQKRSGCEEKILLAHTLKKMYENFPPKIYIFLADKGFHFSDLIIDMKLCLFSLCISYRHNAAIC